MLITKYFFLGVSGASVAEFKTVHQKLHGHVKRAFSLFTVRRDRAVPCRSGVTLFLFGNVPFLNGQPSFGADLRNKIWFLGEKLSERYLASLNL